MFIVLLSREIGASMPNVRRFFFTMLACICVAMLIGGANPPATGDATTAHPIKIEREKQEAVKGEAVFHGFQLKSSYGVLDVDLAKVHSLAVDKVADKKDSMHYLK